MRAVAPTQRSRRIHGVHKEKKLFVKSPDMTQRRRDAEKRRENEEKAQQEPAL
jgi:hypothetical protein